MSFLVFIIIPMAVGLWAQAKIKSAYGKYVQVPSRGQITGYEAANAVMRSSGIHDVEIVETPGQLTDHYDPRNKRLALSHDNYHGTSLAALGVAAHEAGHAIQHAQMYKPLKLRMSLVPITNIASQMLPFVMMGGFFLFHSPMLINLGIGIYIVLTVFQLVTLPVEFDASRRAKAQLVGLGIVEQDELVGVNKTLDAAAPQAKEMHFNRHRKHMFRNVPQVMRDTILVEKRCREDLGYDPDELESRDTNTAESMDGEALMEDGNEQEFEGLMD